MLINDEGKSLGSSFRNFLNVRTSRSSSKRDMTPRHVSWYILEVRFYWLLPGATRYSLEGDLRAISGTYIDLGHTYHNSVALYRYLLVTPSLPMLPTTIH
eukprot:43698-Amorphochlora_amoeboformis.AAC.1